MYAKTLDRSIINNALNLLSKDIKKTYGRKAVVEIVIVGGASITLNYSFRQGTTDIDALVSDGLYSIKESVYRVAKQIGLPDDWLNNDFTKTSSYSRRLIGCSTYYKTYNQVLHVRVVKNEYLIATKLVSARKYKNDLSDIVGIISESPNITRKMVESAVADIYGDTSYVDSQMWDFLDKCFDNHSINDYRNISLMELNNKSKLVRFEAQNEDVLRKDNVDEIIKILNEKGFDSDDKELP